jgi:toxin CcdB
MQLDVFPNPLARARRAFPYVVLLQSDVSALGSDRIIAFLATKAQFGPPSSRLMPIVEVGGRDFVLLMPSITNVPMTELRGPIGNLNAFRDRIVDAIDWTFLGI